MHTRSSSHFLFNLKLKNHIAPAPAPAPAPASCTPWIKRLTALSRKPAAATASSVSAGAALPCAGFKSTRTFWICDCSRCIAISKLVINWTGLDVARAASSDVTKPGIGVTAGSRSARRSKAARTFPTRAGDSDATVKRATSDPAAGATIPHPEAVAAVAEGGMPHWIVTVQPSIVLCM